MIISILSETSISATGGGGGSLYTPLVPGADPANQTLSHSTTSTTVTFNAASGGSGSYSYSASLAHVVGSGASIAGSGLGPYTISNLQPGDVVEVTLASSDTGTTAQVVYSYCIISVYGDYVPLVAAGAPADQNLAATATSSTPASFTAATGGSGSYSYSASLVQSVGSGATLSGSGLGPYTVNDLEFGDVVEVVMTTTDAGPTAQQVTSSFVVSVVQLSSVVTPAANPANQSLAFDATSAGPFTFTAPSGGSGSFSYSAALVEDAGTGGILSGTGLGPYTVSNLSQGDIVTVVLTSTDNAGINQEVQNFATGAVAASYDVLSPATPPAQQNLVAGTTTSGGITFSAATGGSGAYTYSATLTSIAGTGSNLSGSGLGPYTVSDLENGDVVAVVMTTTDAGSVPQTTKSRAYVVVANAALVPGAQTGSEVLPTGTTTSSSFTFNAASGGTGPYSYSVAMVQLIGTGASLSGSGLGPYTVNNLNDGDIVRVTLTVVDDTTLQEVYNTATIVVLQAATFTPVVPGADPADQLLAAGTTSTNITFNAASGGTGNFTYSAAIEQTLGTGTTLSGSGLGPYTVNGLSDGYAVKVTLTATDQGLVSQQVTSVCQIGVLTAAASGSWQTVIDQDMTALDPVAPFFSGSQPVTIGGAPWSTLTATRSTSTNAVTEINASGLYYGGTNGTDPLNVVLDLNTPAALTDSELQLGTVIVQFVAQQILVNGTSNYVAWGITTGTTSTATTSIRNQYRFASGTYNLRVQKASTTIVTVSSDPTMVTEAVTSVAIIAGRLVYIKTDLGTTTLPDGFVDLTGYTYLGISAETATTAQTFGAVLRAFFYVRCSGTPVENYVTRIRILKWS